MGRGLFWGPVGGAGSNPKREFTQKIGHTQFKYGKGVYTENPTLPIEKWRLDYNEFRPHSSFDDLTPRQFVDKYKSSLEAEKLHFWPDHFSGQAH